MTDRYDVAVIGAGIVGLATARAIAKADPSRTILVLEKEPVVAAHQTGRNSGVIHAGVYYRPGSLKARLCVEGGARLVTFCEERGITITRHGKLIVATRVTQVPALEELGRRAAANGVRAIRIGPEEIQEREPYVRGVAGLRVPFTGSVDFTRVAAELVSDLSVRGTEVRTEAAVRSARPRPGSPGRILETESGSVEASIVVNCAGLHADSMARLLGTDPATRLLPFRGEYWSLAEEAAHRIRGHVYPVPDPRFSHLGVHFTRSVDGRVEIGPNAVWAWGREAYGRLSCRPADALETLSYRGFWHLAARHWKTAVAEQWRSLSRRAFVANARGLMPALEVGDLEAWRSGVRAQAVGPDGSLIDDFVIREEAGVVNVVNAPSPAATSCLTIGEHIGRIALSGL